ncbi:hypothetical protein JF66_17495 [Cryobacterium sp. MLB-32]|nr:hypothetical protein JF66_17495 [Cryobacterium sp. MLB-32]
MRSHLTPAQLLLAGRAALAAGIAWYAAPFMPGVAHDYPYYAPLGALISMYPTVMSSVRNGLQTLAGLVIGAGLAAAVIILSEPSVLTIPLVIGLGFLISGGPLVKTTREFVPITALFVLIVGGPNADSYSIGYLVQVCLGIVVGLSVNMLILPRLGFKEAISNLSVFRAALAKHLDEVGDALNEQWPPKNEEWARRSETLALTASAVRDAVSEADDSRKGNPRARFHPRDLAVDFHDLAALETVTFHVRDLTEILAAAVWGKPFPVEIPAELCAPLSEAMHAVAKVLTAWDAQVGATKPFTDAENAVARLMARLDEHLDAGATALIPIASITMDFRRILTSLQPCIARHAEQVRVESTQ